MKFIKYRFKYLKAILNRFLNWIFLVYYQILSLAIFYLEDLKIFTIFQKRKF